MSSNYIIGDIISEYNKKNKEEMSHFRRKYCFKCKNISSQICEIRRNIENKLTCAYYEQRESKKR